MIVADQSLVCIDKLITELERLTDRLKAAKVLNPELGEAPLSDPQFRIDEDHHVVFRGYLFANNMAAHIQISGGERPSHTVALAMPAGKPTKTNP